MKPRDPGTREPPKNPCRRCPKWRYDCHGACEAYLAFWNWNREQDTLRLQDANLNEFKIYAMEKIKRYQRNMKGKKH